MLLPCRHSAKLNDVVDYPPMPVGVEWDGIKIAYLDRDGVLNIGSKNYINSISELIVFPDAGDTIAEIRKNGYRICIVTNQSPIGRGNWDHDNLAKIHDELKSQLLLQNSDAHLDLILYSPYAPWENSWARKGNPGMLQVGRQILTNDTNEPIRQFNFGPDYIPSSKGSSFMVGDRDVDIEAGIRFGIRSFYCDPRVGISDVLSRLLDVSDIGDELL